MSTGASQNNYLSNIIGKMSDASSAFFCIHNQIQNVVHELPRFVIKCTNYLFLSSFVVKQCNIECKDCGLTFTHLEVFKSHLHQHALEEEEQARDNGSATAELVSGREEDRENRGEHMGGMNSSLKTKPSGLMQDDGVGTAPVQSKYQKVYSCFVCGKAYSYLVSFRKHQQLHENQSSTAKSQSVQNLNKYECPDCGMTFVRRTRLLGHLRVHRSHKPFISKPPRCDQCNKDFTSIKSWMIHIEIHKERPFWCLSCAKGFRDEVSLDKHLQGHSLKQHKCNICCKGFQTPARLMCHYNTHSGAKPYQCSLCGKSFSHPGNLVSHRKKHLRVYASNGMSLGIKNFRAKKQVIKKKRLVLTSVKEVPEMDTQMEELPENEGSVETSEGQSPCEDAEFRDHTNSEESDCGEPMHDIKLSKPPGSAGSDPPGESKSQSVQPQTRLDESEPQEANMHSEHKYWEWECFECDMGFDDVAKLHMHYIKHATGELPFPQDDI